LKALIGAMPVKALPAAWLVGKQMRAPLKAALAKVTSSALRARMRAVLAVDVRSRLAACNVPILYLQAKSDLLVPPGAAKAITRIKPEVQLVAFDAPHFLLQTVPQEAAREVTAFARLSGQR
jgi:pimeloyl-ACP methyl ester carboxylesterase